MRVTGTPSEVDPRDPYEFVDPAERGLCVADGGPALGGTCLLHRRLFLECMEARDA